MSQNLSTDPGDLGTHAYQYLRSHCDTFLETYPEPPQEFEANDVDIEGPELRRLQRHNIIIQTQDKGWYQNRRYQVHPDAWDTAQTVYDQRPTLDCGHTGLRNLGDEYTCSNDECSQTYHRSQVEEAYGIEEADDE